jgi:hypothetical protein
MTVNRDQAQLTSENRTVILFETVAVNRPATDDPAQLQEELSRDALRFRIVQGPERERHLRSARARRRTKKPLLSSCASGSLEPSRLLVPPIRRASSRQGWSR